MEKVSDEGIDDAGSLLRRVAAIHPDVEAFIDGHVRLTFGQWDRAADSVAGQFAEAGVTKGDVVCLVMPSSADYAICYQAAMRLGAITSGINPRLGRREMDSIFSRTSPRVTVLDPEVSTMSAWQLIERGALQKTGRPADAFPELKADDAVAIVWTSGTTGVPKGAVYDHACLRAMVEGAGVLSAPGDRRLSPLPFAHVGYMTRVWDELVHVMTTVILPTPWRPEEHLRLIEAERITVGQGVPTQWELVLKHPALKTTDYGSLRITSTGAARVPPELVRAMRETFGAPVVVRYTSTEACISTGTRVDDPDEIIANTVGRVSDAVELRLKDPVDRIGEVLVRSRARMRGYWKDPERTAEVLDADGWIHTGDLGRLDEVGNLTLVGRAVEMFTRGAYNVYPAEVESALGEHPAVEKVAVIGVPDPVLGSIGVAVVVANRATQPVTLDELRAWSKERVADYKAPDRLELVEDLPLTAMGKVDKRALVTRFTGAL
jgi:acyl-CoA synthetase (AMP-forming)/AMP-acid ligase II